MVTKKDIFENAYDVSKEVETNNGKTDSPLTSVFVAINFSNNSRKSKFCGMPAIV